jgi:hypothetical protein
VVVAQPELPVPATHPPSSLSKRAACAHEYNTFFPPDQGCKQGKVVERLRRRAGATGGGMRRQSAGRRRGGGCGGGGEQRLDCLRATPPSAPLLRSLSLIPPPVCVCVCVCVLCVCVCVCVLCACVRACVLKCVSECTCVTNHTLFKGEREATLRQAESLLSSRYPTIIPVSHPGIPISEALSY